MRTSQVPEGSPSAEMCPLPVEARKLPLMFSRRRVPDPALASTSPLPDCTRVTSPLPVLTLQEPPTLCADIAAAGTGFHVVTDVLQLDVAGARAEGAVTVDVKGANIAGPGLRLHGTLDSLDGLSSGPGAQIGARLCGTGDLVADGNVVAQIGIFNAADANDVSSLLNWEDSRRCA